MLSGNTQNPYTGKEPMARKGRAKAEVVTFIKHHNFGIEQNLFGIQTIKCDPDMERGPPLHAPAWTHMLLWNLRVFCSTHIGAEETDGNGAS